MTIHPRPYRDLSDLEKMRQILIEGRQANNGTFYIHLGDLNWWLFYHDPGEPFSEQIALWEDGDRLSGWVLFTPSEETFDLFVHPSLRGTQQAEEMHLWAEARTIEKVKARGGPVLRAMWTLETDMVRRRFLEECGYHLADSEDRLAQMPYFVRPLTDPVAAPLPSGFIVRPAAGERELENRAAAQYGAFQSKLEWGRYVDRFRRFMQSPGYAQAHDTVVVAPDGRIAAFCIFWLDAVNTVGLFEPVGTHPDFQRQGLGRALLTQCLRWMQAERMTQANVLAEASNSAAIALYQSCGFRIANRMLTYTKEL